MIDTNSPSFHIEVWASHGTGGEIYYWKALKEITPPYDLSSEHETSLAFHWDEKLDEQRKHNITNFWYLDPYTGEVKEEVWKVIGNDELEDELVNKYYTDSGRNRNSLYIEISDWKKQCSHNHRLWQDPVRSEYFMTLQPFSSKHLNEFISYIKLGGIPTRKSLGIEFRNDKKPGLDAIEEYTTNKYYWDDREWNRFFFPDRHTETGEKLN